MSAQIYALLVGINDYSPSVGRLLGCLNDVEHFENYLTDRFDRPDIHAVILKDAEATRPNLIRQFREHLVQAGPGDLVVFQYSGHGARWKSAKEFAEFYPDGWDEGLVCWDSREPGGFDLADKELAVLLAEVAQNKPQITVILDCCHSGSATRSADDFTQLNARQTHEVVDERPLESYLDEYYAARCRRGERFEIPASQHILLSACQRVQKAWEGKDHRGVFSSALLDVLDKSSSDITYADLFVRCRAEVRRRADRQDPQFETYQGFNAYSGFLGGQASRAARRYSVYWSDGWKVDCGALHGLPSDPEKNVEFVLYRKSDQSRAGYAATIQVGPQKSELQLLDFEGDASERYQAEIISLPVPPVMVNLEGDPKGVSNLQAFLNASADGSLGVSFITDAADVGRYTLIAEDGCYLLKLRETGKLIQGVRGYNKTAADYMFTVLKHVAIWEKAQVLQNEATKMSIHDVTLNFVEFPDSEPEYEYSEEHVTLDIRKEDGDWTVVRGKLIAENRSAQPLHIVLIHLSDDFGITVLYNERVEPTDSPFTLTPMGKTIVIFSLDGADGDEVVHAFKLIVSTEKVDDFLLEQDSLEISKIFDPCGLTSLKGVSFGALRNKLVHKNEWFTKVLRIKLVRQLNRVTADDATLADRRITIKGHPSLKAAVSLSAAKTVTRGVAAGCDIYRTLERQGMDLVDFSSTRGDDASILELTDIKNAETLKAIPLKIELDLDLQDDEFVLPLAFDGEHIVLVGEPSKDEAGKTHITIHHIPEIPDNRRSVGKALKLYFFKTYLRRENVDRLAWVEYRPDGSVERHSNGVADKVSAAKNVLLLIHGIIGDTEGIARGMRLATDANGNSLDRKFDLILTYDYESLSTTISKTAVKLKQQLEDVGLHENDDKRLTLAVHSMGGLVSRWFIERDGGNRVVDHLVMFGTPNNGSPFGNVGSARTLSSALITLAINTIPVFAPFGAALLSLLARSAKVTPTLEQMNAASDFIERLNASDDPSVRYTIVAGDVRGYKEESNKLLPRLIAKIGDGVLVGALYGDAGHDIAVSNESIFRISDSRIPSPRKMGVVCHHLNYFISEAALHVLAAVEW